MPVPLAPTATTSRLNILDVSVPLAFGNHLSPHNRPQELVRPLHSIVEYETQGICRSILRTSKTLTLAAMATTMVHPAQALPYPAQAPPYPAQALPLDFLVVVATIIHARCFPVVTF